MPVSRRRRGLRLAAATLTTCIVAYAAAETWSFDLTTTGQDVEFVAPAGLSADLAGYKMIYHVSAMNAGAILQVLPCCPITVEVLDRLPPELRDGTKFLAGPPPLTLLSEDARYPEDPNETAGFQCRITFGMKADGRPYVSATNNILSTFTTLVDPNDPDSAATITLLSVQLIGTVSAEPAPAVVLDPPVVQAPEGSNAALAVTLSMAPAGDVNVSIFPTGTDADLSLNKSALTFTPANWNVPQIIIASAVSDADGASGEETFSFIADVAAPATLRVVEIEPDCDNNGVADVAEIQSGAKADCNSNWLPDACEISAGLADCNANGVPDTCELASGAADCDGNGVPDACDIAGGAADCDTNGVLDRCQPDRDADGRIDACDGCPDDRNKTGPGVCGCGVPEGTCANANTNGSAGDPSAGGGADLNANTNVNGGSTLPGTADPDAPVSNDGSSPTDANTPAAGGETPVDQDAEAVSRALEEWLNAQCGAGMCGVGAVGWLPMTILGLVGLRAARRR